MLTPDQLQAVNNLSIGYAKARSILERCNEYAEQFGIEVRRADPSCCSLPMNDLILLLNDHDREVMRSREDAIERLAA